MPPSRVCGKIRPQSFGFVVAAELQWGVDSAFLEASNPIRIEFIVAAIHRPNRWFIVCRTTWRLLLIIILLLSGLSYARCLLLFVREIRRRKKRSPTKFEGATSRRRANWWSCWSANRDIWKAFVYENNLPLFLTRNRSERILVPVAVMSRITWAENRIMLPKNDDVADCSVLIRSVLSLVQSECSPALLRIARK